jgi:hypothetical protein
MKPEASPLLKVLVWALKIDRSVRRSVRRRMQRPATSHAPDSANQLLQVVIVFRFSEKKAVLRGRSFSLPNRSEEAPLSPPFYQRSHSTRRETGDFLLIICMKIAALTERRMQVKAYGRDSSHSGGM